MDLFILLTYHTTNQLVRQYSVRLTLNFVFKLCSVGISCAAFIKRLRFESYPKKVYLTKPATDIYGRGGEMINL